MANIDISSKLGIEKATIKLAEGKVYEVDTSADNYLLVQEKIKNMKLTIKGLKAVITALSAIVSEVEYEEMEKRFQ